MKFEKLIICSVFAGLLFFSQNIFAESATNEIAEILVHLNHHPSDSEKGKLRALASDNSSSAEIRVLAQALINLNHSASDADKTKLKKIMNDGSAPDDVRTLAGIIHGLNHKPSADDKEKLKKMMD